jgi:hypothetical protein
MAVRDGRAARLRRALVGRPLALVALLYAAAAVAATCTALGSFGSGFIANDRLGGGEPPAGDHLQSVYRFWLVGHQLEHGHAPWKDPYSFQPIVEQQTVVGGWPFGFPFWPLDAAFGPVVAWNVLLLGTVVAAGLLTYWWLRSLALGPLPAALGGLAFAIAPYRLEQSAGHILGWIAVLLPLALLAIEHSGVASTRRRAHAWAAVAALSTTSIALSGQVNLALGAVPLVLVYALVRSGRLAVAWAAAGSAAAAAIGLAIRYTLIAGSPEERGRSIGEVRHYSAEAVDFLNRWHAPRSEEFVYLGWLTVALGLAGFVSLLPRRRGLAILLGVAVVVPVLLALGTNLPGYTTVWRHFPPLHFSRVPGRFLPIADLALAALAAFACAAVLARAGRRATAVGGALLALVALDLIVLPLSATAADPDNGAYRALAASPPGRVLELPLFEPGVHYASVYDYYRLQAPREQPGGYSTLAPDEAFRFYERYKRLNCGVWLPGDEAALTSLGIRRIVFHRGLYIQAHRRGAWFAWRSLLGLGLGPAVQDGAVALFAPGQAGAPTPIAEPPRSRPILCSGWRGRTMLGRQATIWLWGEGQLAMTFFSSTPTTVRIFAGGELLDQRFFDGFVTLRATLADMRWHPLLIEGPPGLRLGEITF